MVKLKDGYQLFLQRFNIQKENLIQFGIEETISIEEEVARIEWNRIKDILNGKEKVPIYIRGAGRNSSSTNLYLDLYEHLFPGVEILVDWTNNDQPRKTLAKCTNFKPAKADILVEKVYIASLIIQSIIVTLKVHLIECTFLIIQYRLWAV